MDRLLELQKAGLILEERLLQSIRTSMGKRQELAPVLPVAFSHPQPPLFIRISMDRILVRVFLSTLVPQALPLIKTSMDRLQEREV